MKESKSENKSGAVIQKTITKGVLSLEPLERDAFFGRETELKYLENAVKERRHVLVSGIGGIGKTELLRQLIRNVEEGGLVDELWLIPWGTSIRSSFLEVTKRENGENREDHFAGIVSELRGREGVKKLIVIDNAEEEIRNDRFLELLSSLSDAVIISSRMSALEGFEVCALTLLSTQACIQVFGYAYGRSLDTSEQNRLEDYIDRLFMRHTLSIGLVGRYMRRHTVPLNSLEEICANLHAYTLPQMYRNMYHIFGMTEDERTILAFLARCPRDSYPLSFIMAYYPHRAGKRRDFLNSIANLADGGWLILDSNRVSVQPYIAENVIKLTSCPEEVKLFVDNVVRKWSGGIPLDEHIFDYIRKNFSIPTEENDVLCDIVKCFCEKYLETISRECFIAYIMTLYKDANWLVVFSQSCLDYMYLKAEEVGLYSEILFKLKLRIRSREQMDELDDFIRNSSDRLSVRFRCAVSAFFIGLLIENYAFDKGIRYADYLIEHTNRTDEQIIAYQCYLTYYLNRENIPMAEEMVKKLDSLKVMGYQRYFIILSECNLYVLTGRYNEAYRLLSEAKAIGLTVRGDTRATYLTQMATVLRVLERYEEAEGYYIELFDYLNTVLELEDSVIVARLRQEYGILLEKMGKFEEAEKQYLSCINTTKDISDQQQINITYNNLAVLYVRMGRGEEALAILDGLMEKAGNTDKTGIFYMEVLNNHSKACEVIGDKARALAETQESYPLLVNVYGMEHRKSIEAKERIERLKASMNQGTTE